MKDKNNKVAQVSKKKTPRDFWKNKHNKVTQVSKKKHQATLWRTKTIKWHNYKRRNIHRATLWRTKTIKSPRYQRKNIHRATDSKQASSKTNISATPISPPNKPPKEHTKIASKPKLSFVGDSNVRNLTWITPKQTMRCGLTPAV